MKLGKGRHGLSSRIVIVVVESIDIGHQFLPVIDISHWFGHHVYSILQDTTTTVEGDNFVYPIPHPGRVEANIGKRQQHHLTIHLRLQTASGFIEVEDLDILLAKFVRIFRFGLLLCVKNEMNNTL